MEETKRCPYCGEEILAIAKKCRHCGKWLTDNTQTVHSESNASVAAKLQDAIKQFVTTDKEKSDSVLFEGETFNKALEYHKKLYAEIGSDEHVMIVINKKMLTTPFGYGWTGAVITDKYIYCRLLRDAFWSSLISISKSFKFPLETVHNMRMGEHDHCYGTAYIGHQLLINNQNLGLLRMGNGVLYDDDMIEELNFLFSSFS